MIRGWCPTVHAPMPSGDGLLVRVKPFGGRISSVALHALAEAAAEYGNGVIELTSRGNLQVRGMREPVAFAKAMVAAGLADADPVREARRNVVTVPPCDDALVAAAEAILAETAGLAPKFCVVVRGSQVHAAGETLADADAIRRFLSCQASSLVSTAPREPWQMEGGTRPQHGPFDVTRPTSWIPGSSPGMTLLLYLPFGQTDATSLAHLATIAPEIRTTPWRAFLSPILAPGFLAAPSPIAACPGGPACASGTVPARADAARLQAAGFTKLHVSGCAKGCAHPGATTTLVGRDGRYDLVRHGRAGDPPDLHSLTLDEAMSAL